MDERKSLILEERKGDMVAGHGFTRRTFIKGSAAIGAMAAISGTTLGVLSSCSTSAGDGAVTFENITEGVERRLKPNAISFTEARTFKMVVPIGGSKEEIQEKNRWRVYCLGVGARSGAAGCGTLSSSMAGRTA